MSIQPTDIQWKKQSNSLFIRFSDGSEGSLEAEFLRVHSPSAEVQGHGSPVLQSGKRHVRLSGIEPVGNYAVKLSFDDGHDTGLFSWELLHRFVANHQAMWRDYLQRLNEAGLSREPTSQTRARFWTP